MVSNRLAQAEVDYLEGLVTDNVFRQIKKNLPKFSPNQRQDLIVTEDEILVSFLRDMTITEGKYSIIFLNSSRILFEYILSFLKIFPILLKIFKNISLIFQFYLQYRY